MRAETAQLDDILAQLPDCTTSQTLSKLSSAAVLIDTLARLHLAEIEIWLYGRAGQGRAGSICHSDQAHWLLLVLLLAAADAHSN